MSVLVHAGLLMATGTAAAAALIPALNKSFMGDVKRDWLGGQVEFDSVEPDNVTIRLKSGRYCRIVAIEGVSYDAMVPQEVISLSEARGTAFGRLAGAGITARIFAIKRQAPVRYKGEWPEGNVEEIGKAEEKKYSRTFAIGWFVMLDSTNRQTLHKEGEGFISLMQKFKATYLSVKRDTEKEDDYVAAASAMKCTIPEFVNYLMTGDMVYGINWIRENMSFDLGNSNLSISDNGDIKTSTPHDHLQRMIAVRRWPEDVSGMIVGDLLRIPHEIELSHVVLPEGKKKVQLLLNQKAGELEKFSALGGDTTAEDFHEYVEVLSKDSNINSLKTEFVVCLRTKDEKEMEKALSAVEEVLGRYRVIYNRETSAVGVLWFNRMPAPKHKQGRILRPLRILTTNIGPMWPFNSMISGNVASPWGDSAVRLFTGSSGQSYRFQFHASAAPQSVGHYLVLAPTGGGKTTIMMHLLSGLMKFKNVRSYVFDSREGTRFSIEAMGGNYKSFDTLDLNPLDVDDTPENRNRIGTMVKAMIPAHVNDENMKEMVDAVINFTFTAKPHNRTFNQIFPLAFPRDEPATKSFLQWVVDKKHNKGLYHHVFNAKKDGLNEALGKAQITGINMNEALGNPELGPPVVTHIMNKISDTAKALAGENVGGFNIFIDEAAKLLENAGFRGAVVEMYREYRKLNGVVGMAFQDPSALHKSGIAEAVIDNTSTLIIFPNPQARAEDYAAFNLNEEQIAFITTTHKGRKVLVVRRDGPSGLDETVVLDADLGWLGESMRFYKSGPDAVKKMVRLQKSHPENWRDLI